MNGDGFDDLIIGAYRASPNGLSRERATWSLGEADGFGATLNLSRLDGTNGFKLLGEAACDHSGMKVSGAGDVNGDGFDDLIIGASDTTSNVSLQPRSEPRGFWEGERVWGRRWSFRVSTAPMVSNCSAKRPAYNLGSSVSGAGDVNGDGIDDLIIGARYADPFGSNSGASYVVFGQASGFGTTLELSSLMAPMGSSWREERAMTIPEGAW